MVVVVLVEVVPATWATPVALLLARRGLRLVVVAPRLVVAAAAGQTAAVGVGCTTPATQAVVVPASARPPQAVVVVVWHPRPKGIWVVASQRAAATPQTAMMVEVVGA